MKKNYEEKREKKMSVLVLDTEIMIPRAMDIEPTFKCYQSLLKCSETSSRTFKIEGTYYGFISDSRAMNKTPNKVTVIGADGKPYLCGNLIICRLNKECSPLSLTNDDYNKLSYHLRLMNVNNKKWLCVTDAEFTPLLPPDVRKLVDAINMAMKLENGSIDG